MPLTVILTANTALPWSSSAVTGDALQPRPRKGWMAGALFRNRNTV